VLDFGLAKMLEPEPARSPSFAGTMSPTLSIHATVGGVILGTAAYMSPEQARGKPVDRRTDIWSFGCVLFEMLTGKQTFDPGETISDAVAHILTREPDWNALPPDTPLHVRTLLRRCLRKDPQKRLPHIGLVRLELDEGPNRIDDCEAVPTDRPDNSRGLESPSRSVRSSVPSASGGCDVGADAHAVRHIGAAPLQHRAGGNAAVYRQRFLSQSDHFARRQACGVRRVRDQRQLVDGACARSTRGGPIARSRRSGISFHVAGWPLDRILCPTGRRRPQEGLNHRRPGTHPRSISGHARGATWGTDDTIVFATNDLTTGLLKVQPREVNRRC